MNMRILQTGQHHAATGIEASASVAGEGEDSVVGAYLQNLVAADRDRLRNAVVLVDGDDLGVVDDEVRRHIRFRSATSQNQCG